MRLWPAVVLLLLAPLATASALAEQAVPWGFPLGSGAGALGDGAMAPEPTDAGQGPATPSDGAVPSEAGAPMSLTLGITCPAETVPPVVALPRILCPDDAILSAEDVLLNRTTPDGQGGPEPAANATGSTESNETLAPRETGADEEPLGQAPPSADTAPEPAAPGPAAVVPAPRPQAPLLLATAPAASGLGWAVAGGAAVVASLLLKLLGLLAVRRRDRRHTAVMEAVLREIQRAPGLPHTELVRRIGRGNGSVEHALQVLGRGRLVAAVRTGRYTCYFAGGATPPEAKAAWAALGNASARRILAAVVRQEHLSLSQAASRVGLAVSSVHYHVRRLSAAGLLDARRLQGRVALGVTPLGARLADDPRIRLDAV